MVITRSLVSMPIDTMPHCNETYLHQATDSLIILEKLKYYQCGKIGEINDDTCTEYCQYPVVSGSTTASKTIQVQNYFSLKDDGQYTCTAIFSSGTTYQAVETMKYPNRKLHAPLDSWISYRFSQV